MEIAFFITIILGSIAVLLSLETDKLKKQVILDKKTQDDKIYKLSVLKDVQGKIAYTSDAEKVIDTITGTLRNLFNYSIASSMVILDNNIIFKAYVEEKITKDYIDQIEKNMLSSLSTLTEKLPSKIDKSFYGIVLNDPPAGGSKTTYSSSFHIPLIVKNKVLGLIHLSSTKADIYKEENMETLYELVEIAASSLTHFSKAIDVEKNVFISLANTINDGLFMADNKNNLLFINDSAKKILGIDKDNVSFFDILNIFANDFHLASTINDVCTNNKPFAAKELILNEKILDIFITPLGDNKVSVALHDMTEYKQRESAKEDQMHIMVHELRAPITTVKDAAELILSTPDLEKDKKSKFLNIIEQQAKKILDQIGSILDTAKLDAGKLTLQKTKGDIAKSIKSEIETFVPQAQRKKIDLSFDVKSHTLPLISFDPMKITQVIDNLLSNSIKFTPEHGKVNVELDYRVIPPTQEEFSPMKDFLSLDKYVVVSVSDTGVGIDKEQQKFLFSKYIQAKNSPQQLSKLGTGLGLYVVKGIIESHGGRVWVKSTPGQGTTICFSLPATDDVRKSYDEPKPTSLSKLARTVN